MLPHQNSVYISALSIQAYVMSVVTSFISLYPQFWATCSHYDVLRYVMVCSRFAIYLIAHLSKHLPEPFVFKHSQFTSSLKVASRVSQPYKVKNYCLYL